MVILTIILFYGCEGPDDEGYEQFITDELAWLKFSRDSLFFTGEKVTGEDTILFLYNSTDTINVKIYTQIITLGEVTLFGKYGISGKTEIYFPDSIFINIASLKIDKDTPEHIRSFEFVITTAIQRGPFIVSEYNNENKIENDLDTALVQGHLYSDVKKFEYNKKPSDHDFKKIFYARKSGYIYIESFSGNKLEMLPPGDS